MAPMNVPLDNWWWGAVSYVLCHLAHILIWRRKLPRRDIASLLEIFFLPMVPILPWTLTSGATIAPLLIHGALSAHYIAIYPAFQASSPTLHILDLLSRQPSGLSAPVIAESLAHLHRGDERVEDLLASRLVVEREGALVLSRRGRWVARAFGAYRGLLGLPAGEG